ncbi:MAG: PAS domain S-box protein [Candidatus Bathyarchaeota archaeon]|nr:PAS domain S-box protein [Candidatus Bathyarchaeota archaeon]
MRIRYKILLILGLIMICLLGSLYLLANTIAFGTIAKMENAYSSTNAQRFVKNLNVALVALNTTVKDWAAWDETYQFIDDHNPAFLDSNLMDVTFQNLNLNMMLFFNQEGQFIYGKTYDPTDKTGTEINQKMIPEIVIGYLLSNSSINSNEGLISFNGSTMLVAAHSILTSMQEGPSHGTLIIGRYLSSELESLSVSTGLPISVASFGDPEADEDFKTATHFLSQQSPIYAAPINETSTAGYVLLNDVAGKPLIIAKVIDERVQYFQGKSAIFYATVFIVGTVLVIFFAIGILLDKFVVSRISYLNDSVIKIRKTGDNSKRVALSGNDELSSLSENINEMLDVIDSHTLSLENTVKERTKDLFENKKKLQSILQASPDAIIAVDIDGYITECNNQVTAISGFDREYLLSKPSIEFIPEEHRSKLIEQMQKMIQRKNGTERFETVFLKKDGSTYPAEFSVKILRDENDQPLGYVGIIRDLSERKLLEQRLLKSQRLAAIGELAGMVGHDIRNPLAAIRNAHYYIKKKCRGCMKGEILPMLEIIDKSIDHADSIVNDLLEYSKDLKLDLVERSPKELLEKALKLIKTSHNVRVVDSTTDTKLKVDENKALRVFVNLIKNAFDAMPRGGTLEVKSALDEQGQVTITFSDTGVGIPSDMLPKVFTPLFTTKAQGMGFGLAISKRIVEAHGGHISVKSEVGKGTTFTVVLPTEPTANHDVVNDDLTADF